MAPDSRVILTRHAQAEHNVGLDYSIPDAPLTPLGKKQAAALAPQVDKLAQEVDLVVSSPLQRTLQTTALGWKAAIDRLGGFKKVVCLPQAQECNAHPCDTGSSRAELEANPEFAVFDLSQLPADWTSKKGFWAADSAALTNRARWVRQWLRERPEKTIVLVAHGDVLRRITASSTGPSTYQWRNAEAREFVFDPKTVDDDECFLIQEEDIAVAGGYAITSTEMDLAIENGNAVRSAI
ncbi:phosphoglycerate mutase-like protein [Acrodontium crateriforme]|uniref:Phosphoglycerate mutase-like protein n=1 Tax=Acrodontium crateriforme TaxID=150365 RepID=A0AAQ3RCZ9_9PEZI|nr:phosphoglycerate mutase-like protein [Acrodontium crateriforme]